MAKEMALDTGTAEQEKAKLKEEKSNLKKNKKNSGRKQSAGLRRSRNRRRL